MNQKGKKILIAINVICLVAILAIIVFFYYGCQSAKLVSCTNHVIQLRFIIRSQFEDDDGVMGLPYDKDLPGYAVIARINHGTLGPKVNCNHGNPDGMFGGWQYLNLPVETLARLHVKWDQEQPDKNMPVLWCGKGSGSKRTTLVLIDFKAGRENPGDFWLSPRYMSDRDLESLNECLKEIGEKPVPIDIPENIDWRKYRKKKMDNSEASGDS